MGNKPILDTATPAKDVLEQLNALAATDMSGDDVALVSGRYDAGAEVNALARTAYMQFLDQNALYFNLYPSVVQMERALVETGLDLLRGSGDCCGMVSSGGTESIILAVKAARDYARATRPEIKTPKMVLPITVHPAFHKAAQYLGVELVITKVDPTGFRADLSDFEAALDDQCILAVGSAPNYSHGTVDAIADMSEMARKRNILFHVDGCVGGLYLSFLRRLGQYDTPFDFSLPGVTSISADLHKYGYAPKNASLVMFRHRALRKAAWFINSTTTEYAVINPTVQSTRTAGPIAAAWAVMKHLGYSGYEAMTEVCQNATAKTITAISDNPDIRVLADPEMSMFTLASDTVNIFEIDDEMRDAGWVLTPQFACGGGPANAHVSVHMGVLDQMPRFADDLRRCSDRLKLDGSSVDLDAIQSAFANVAGAPLEQMMGAMLPLAGLTGPDLPEKSATLNTILNLMPGEMRDQALGMYLSMIR
ncbi:aspartate aminotransferase family protein [Tateyamaria omphalii]|uniref:pyridoxal phosphate-dependent decarboxylase family protein n=1 Tax=Tateyamaria omphalii TaxID=299262 RepID=UPI0016795E1B|nr:aminotransferase class V-fold PLP-dependent enzyme [Tateyamaria omphalii]GGX42957.1 aspartate aminotransferase family protein [Tateyamaria omphalii]